MRGGVSTVTIFEDTLYGKQAREIIETYNLKSGKPTAVPAMVELEYRNVEGRDKLDITIYGDPKQETESMQDYIEECKTLVNKITTLAKEVAAQ